MSKNERIVVIQSSNLASSNVVLQLEVLVRPYQAMQSQPLLVSTRCSPWQSPYGAANTHSRVLDSMNQGFKQCSYTDNTRALSNGLQRCGIFPLGNHGTDA